MRCWLFSSVDLENIRVGYERLLWGFWDKEAGEKQKKNWRAFLRTYNTIKPFDFAAIQIASNGYIHAFGIIRNTFYDDQTLVWPREFEQKRVLYPWRVSFSLMIFSEEPILTRFIKIQDYIDGYGIGEISPTDIQDIFTETSKKFKLKIKGETQP
jgi:hypothetical protein